MTRKMFALGAALLVLAIAAATSQAAVPNHWITCRPPLGPGGNQVHSADVHAIDMNCAAARWVMIRCDRFSYGVDGTCRTLGYRWRCTSRSLGGLESSERCQTGRAIVSWIWLD